MARALLTTLVVCLFLLMNFRSTIGGFIAYQWRDYSQDQKLARRWFETCQRPLGGHDSVPGLPCGVKESGIRMDPLRNGYDLPATVDDIGQAGC